MEHNKTVVYLLIILVAFTVYAISSVQYSGYGVRVGSEYGQPTAFTQTARQSPTTGFSSYCGDGNCTGNETCANCQTDCGPCGPSKRGLPMIDKRVFVTSATFSGNLGGLMGANQKCASAAANAGLGGVWVPWLSIQNQSNVTNNTGVWHAKDHITNAKYVSIYSYSNSTTYVIANSKTDLLDGSLQNPIDINELGYITSGWVWTGTNNNGLATGKDCNGWQTSSNVGTYGQISKYGWSQGSSSALICSQPFRLYCFEK